VNKIFFALVSILTGLVLASCNGGSGKNQAVCEAYQSIADLWPSNSAEFENFSGDLGDFWREIQADGATLESAAAQASDGQLSKSGVEVGSFVAGYYDRNKDSSIGQGFVPYFGHNIVGGQELSDRCAELGFEISMP